MYWTTRTKALQSNVLKKFGTVQTILKKKIERNLNGPSYEKQIPDPCQIVTQERRHLTLVQIYFRSVYHCVTNQPETNTYLQNFFEFLAAYLDLQKSRI